MHHDLLSAHDWAAIFQITDAAGARHLRATCRAAQLGYDCAVQAGWIPLSAHRSAEPEEDGATCMWVSGWFPVSLKALQAPAAFANPPPMTVRLEHRFVAKDDAPRRWSAHTVVVAETLRTAAAADADLDTPVVRCCDPEARLQFAPLAATTARIHGPKLFAGSHVRAIDTAGLTSIVSVGSHFASGCKSLTTLDVSGLTSVTAIGKHFASNCGALASVRARPGVAVLPALTTLGDSFLHAGTSLTTVDLSGLRNLREIPSSFLCCCKALASVDLSALTTVSIIGSDVLSCCDALTSVDLSGLTSVTAIGTYFLSHAKMESLDLLGLCNVTCIDEGFAFECQDLRSVDPTPLRALRQFDPNYFLDRTPAGSTGAFDAWLEHRTSF
jgi:hypothetical protein